ncbi:UMP-CMP kinase [Artemisia annua]|uniref:adenylate kinase n=1 Tax=Artemisia annua TaxID=35608 RepID=A0A2U1PPE1_ARTAN|nr:UMP-CMP kinase [Artemisia annua]
MFRRVTTLFTSAPKPSLLNQVAYGCSLYTTRMSDSEHRHVHSDCGYPGLKELCKGGPGVGKGTQCTRIAETYGFTHLSVGDLLRNEISSTSEYGDMILETITKGKIVSSEVTVKLLKKAIETSEADRFLVDGFPRTEENRVAYEQIIGIEPEVVLFFDCDEEEMMKRVLHRNQGRVDDNIDTTIERLKVFEAYTLPVIRYYTEKGKLYKINAIGTEDEIFERVRPIFST